MATQSNATQKTVLRLTPFPYPGVGIPNSKGHTEAWESISPTKRATPKHGCPSPQLKGPHRSMGAPNPNSMGHATKHGLRTPRPPPNPSSKGHATKRGLRVPDPNSKGHATKRGLTVPNSRGHATERELRIPNPSSKGDNATKLGNRSKSIEERSTVLAPNRILCCTWAGVLLRITGAAASQCVAPFPMPAAQATRVLREQPAGQLSQSPKGQQVHPLELSNPKGLNNRNWAG